MVVRIFTLIRKNLLRKRDYYCIFSFIEKTDQTRRGNDNKNKY